ncbi:MBL fold metallo-hydrolase [Curvibacter sp. HBC28]|uniref:MBL fold metallo-hydrolase n=1 Tax=Curvibacter microcysteis TaxID=3026419 RepID=A0ABT5MBX5_9BURK|nr:MBL fold metallo-hydrolase [Curvibacter sp. HBC28]MDD0813499.1 MBL fold metallo-hydrolase [Curvibacter sp. HBC28]
MSASTEPPALPAGLSVFERGWLSANNILLRGPEGSALIDSGYASHSEQTLALVGQALGAQPLDQLFNTHLHSDHCGGNAALQAAYPQLHTAIPPGEAELVRQWDEDGLSYQATGQACPRFRFDAVLQPGQTLRLGGADWQVHAAPGHDPHSVIFFEPATRTLISADALWQNGFGVVFPELEGVHAFDEVGATLDLIETLAPRTVIPGHGAVFHDATTALAVARRRLDGFQRDPAKHQQYATKVLLKFKLLEWQQIGLLELAQWMQRTPYMVGAARRQGQAPSGDWLEQLVGQLVASGAARLEGEQLLNL